MSLKCLLAAWLSLQISFGNAIETQDADFYILSFAQNLEKYYMLSTPTVGSRWDQCGVMAASHCLPWWGWWSHTLWVTHKGYDCTLSWHVCFGCVGADTMVTSKVFWRGFSASSSIYKLLQQMHSDIRVSSECLRVLWTLDSNCRNATCQLGFARSS
jgi:hypothetical protein